MNLKNVANIPIARRELLVMEASLMSCQNTIEALKSNVLRAQNYATLLRQSFETNNATDLFDAYTNLKQCCGSFDSHDKLLQELKDLSNDVSDRMRITFGALHFDLMMRAEFDDKNYRKK